MKVAITGTPGTGKTSVAAFLAEKGYEVRSFDELAEDFVVGYDEERKCKIVDTEEMDKAFRNIREEGIMFVEGHLAHMLSVDFVIVLRCDPSELEKRLKAKRWEDKKIKENLEAEAMDLILSQSCDIHEGHVAEIDTTGREAKEVAEEIDKIVEDGFTNAKVGVVGYSKWLMEHAGQI